MVEEHQPNAGFGEPGRNFVGLAAAKVKTRIGPLTVADNPFDRFQSGRAGQCLEFVERRRIASFAPDRDGNQQCCRAVWRWGDRGVQLS